MNGCLRMHIFFKTKQGIKECKMCCYNNVYNNASSKGNATTMQRLVSDGGIATMSRFNNGGHTWSV